GPHPTYTSAATPQPTSYPSSAHRAAMPPSGGAYGPTSAPPQSGNPAETSVTSLHWPGSSGSGATTRGLVTSSPPSPTPARGMLTMGILSVVMLAAGAIAAAVFFGVRQHGPAQAPGEQGSASPSATVAAAQASAMPSSSAASAPPPASAAAAEPPAASAAAQ